MLREMMAMLREYIASELAKIKNLERGKRAGYVMDYHKGKLAAVVAITLCITAAVVGAAYHRDTVFNLALVNCGTDFSADESLEQELGEYFGINFKKQAVNADSAYNIVWGESAPDNADYADYEKFFFNLSSGEIDCAVAPVDFFEYCLEMGLAATPVEELADCDTQRVFITADGTAGGIYVNVADAAQEYVAFFPENGKNPDYAKLFAEKLAAGDTNT